MSLELKGKIKGNVRRYVVKADKTNDGKTALVDIELVLNEVDAEALGGRLFRTTCFSDFVGKSGAATIDRKKLGGELKVKAEHTVEIDSYKLSTKPKVLELSVSRNDRVVELMLRLPIPGPSKKLRSQLDASVGDDVELNFIGVTQTEVPGTNPETQHGPAAQKPAKGKKGLRLATAASADAADESAEN